VAGFDINEQTRNSAADKRPTLKLASSLDALMKHHLDGLILALPHHVYAEEWEKLLSFGLPILKEKPLGRNLTEARSFVRKAWEKECPLQTAIQRREHPSYKHLLNLLKERKVSDVHFAMHLGFEQPVSDAQTTKQLDSFAQHIQNNSRRPSQYWDQLPAQKIIEQAYQMSSNLYGTDHATH